MARAPLFAYIGLGLAMLGPLTANVRLLPPLAGFVLFVAGSLFALGGAIAHTVRLVRRGASVKPGELYALTAFAPALLIVLLLAKALKSPPINDISTDLNDVPRFTEAAKLPANAGRDLDYPEAFKEMVKKHYPNLDTRVVPGKPDEVMERARNLFGQRSYIKVTRDDRPAGEMELICESGVFRFKDDVILRFRPNRMATAIDIRSKSRDGKGDAGANAARIRDFYKALESGKWE